VAAIASAPISLAGSWIGETIGTLAPSGVGKITVTMDTGSRVGDGRC